jgi:hypothetical protein
MPIPPPATALSSLKTDDFDFSRINLHFPLSGDGTIRIVCSGDIARIEGPVVIRITHTPKQATAKTK